MMKTRKRKHKRKQRPLTNRGRYFLRIRREHEFFIESTLSRKFQILNFVSEIFRVFREKVHL